MAGLPSRSAGFTLGAIFAAHAVLLAGLALGWPAAAIAFLFWFEAALVGGFTLLKVAASLPGYVPPEGTHSRYRRRAQPGRSIAVSSSVPRIGKAAAVPLFIVLYGLVLALYATLLLHAVGARSAVAAASKAMAVPGVALAMGAFALEHAWAFWRDFVRGPEWARSDPVFHFWRPFGLAFLVWLAFLGGFLLFGWMRSPLPMLVVLIVLKMVAESFGALVDHQAGPWEPAPGDALVGECYGDHRDGRP